jgi:hypothetical protein
VKKLGKQRRETRIKLFPQHPKNNRKDNYHKPLSTNKNPRNKQTNMKNVLDKFIIKIK